MLGSFIVESCLITGWESRSHIYPLNHDKLKLTLNQNEKQIDNTLNFQLNTFKNVEGGTVGRILSYYDLCDIPQQAGNSTVDKDLDFSEFMTEEESEEVELRRQQREEEELRKREEEEWLLAEEERKAREEEEETRRRRSIRIMEEKRRAEKEAKEPRETADIFREINQKRKHSVRPKSAHTNNSK